MKIIKTFKQTYELTKYNIIKIDGVYYEVSSIYKNIIDILHMLLMVIYFFGFIFGVSVIGFTYPILGIITGFLGMYLLMYFAGFIFTYFAPLKEVEKPEEEIKKPNFFDRYKLYKAKQINQLKEKEK
jgi:hypothetical protein